MNEHTRFIKLLASIIANEQDLSATKVEVGGSMHLPNEQSLPGSSGYKAKLSRGSGRIHLSVTNVGLDD